MVRAAAETDRRAAWRATVALEVPFHDADPAGVVWHGHYYKYFEIARTALMRQLDYDVDAMVASGYAWPVIESHCRYAAPLRYGQAFTVEARVVEYESRLKIGYEVRSGGDAHRVARGHTIQVALELEGLEMRLQSPAVLLEKLGVEP